MVFHGVHWSAIAFSTSGVFVSLVCHEHPFAGVRHFFPARAGEVLRSSFSSRGLFFPGPFFVQQPTPSTRTVPLDRANVLQVYWSLLPLFIVLLHFKGVPSRLFLIQLPFPRGRRFFPSLPPLPTSQIVSFTGTRFPPAPPLRRECTPLFFRAFSFSSLLCFSIITPFTTKGELSFLFV